MNSFQFINALKPVSNFVVKRYAFTPKDRIILLNSQSKSLYGPVIKTKPPSKRLKLTNVSKAKKTISSSSSSDGRTTVRKPETNYDSEMYWVTGNRMNDLVDKRTPRIIDTATVGKGVLQDTEKLSQYNQTNQSKILPEIAKVIHTDTTEEEPAPIIHQPIPFSNEELTKLLKHPLHSDVLSTAPYNIRAPELRSIPSVGKVLQYTMTEAARSALLKWKLARISELGEQGFAELQQSHLNTGKAFHGSLEQYFISNEVPTASSPIIKLWESVSGVLDKFSAMPESVEKTVFHPTLKYKGICDCVSEVNDQLTIIEWKKSGRSKPTLVSTYDSPLQLCAYLGAMNTTLEYQGRIRNGMIVMAYENGEPADVHEMNEVMLRRYWRIWLGRLHEFWIRSRDGTLMEPI